MTVPLLEQVPFVFGTAEWIVTSLAVVINLAINGPRLVKSFRRKADAES